jgi:hypothetical protein
MRSNIPLLEAIAKQLGPLLPELVFVGGITTELFFTNPAASDVRATRDADVICEVSGRVAYHQLATRLREHGFREDSSPGAPLCRWKARIGLLDVMPTDPELLGFSNPWYPRAIATAEWVALSQDLRIRVVSAPMFVATKLAAYEGRGQNDLLRSHDIEDILAVVAFREELVEEVRAEPDEARLWVAVRIRRHLIEDPNAEYALVGGIPGAARVPGLIPTVSKRIALIAGLARPI